MTSPTARAPRRVLILGGGFGGLWCARSLRRAPVEVVLVDRRNFHLFQPLLYQVAIGGLAPSDVAAPLRWVLRNQANARVVLDEAVDVDLERRVLTLALGELPYDELVVAAGAETHWFGNDAWADRAPGLKSIGDATEMRRRILRAFERAARATDEAARRRAQTFLVVGGGPTGVELAGAIAELARDTLRREYREVDTRASRIVLAEGGPRLLPGMGERSGRRAAEALVELGVELRTDTALVDLADGRATLERGGEREVLEADTVLWAAGVRAAGFGARLAERAGVERDRGGRLPVEPDLSLAGHPEVRVVGDLARCEGADGEPLPGVAPVAIQQGRHAARAIRARLAGRAPEPFRYRDKGTLATIGRSRAVAEVGRLRVHGWPAWWLWLVVHVAFLIGFHNRAIVLFKWAWAYLTYNRAARLILPSREDGEER